MREFIKLPRRAWSFAGFLAGWSIPLGIALLVKADGPTAVGLLALLSGITLAGMLFLHRAQWRSSERHDDKRREDEERRRQAIAYQQEIEARNREYEAFRRRNGLDG